MTARTGRRPGVAGADFGKGDTNTDREWSVPVGVASGGWGRGDPVGLVHDRPRDERGDLTGGLLAFEQRDGPEFLADGRTHLGGGERGVADDFLDFPCESFVQFLASGFRERPARGEQVVGDGVPLVVPLDAEKRRRLALCSSIAGVARRFVLEHRHVRRRVSWHAPVYGRQSHKFRRRVPHRVLVEFPGPSGKG